MKKRIFSAVICVTVAASMLSGCSLSRKSAGSTASGDGNTLVIYSCNDDFQQTMINYASDIIPGNVNTKIVTTGAEDGEYQAKLDATLPKQTTLGEGEKIDMFLMQAPDTEKYVNSDYTLDVRGDLGITDGELSDQFGYMQQLVTDNDGKLKALSWEAAPGFFAYRRSIAKDVLGTDDPDQVQDAISDWDRFNDVAAKAKKKGYFMLSGYNDSYRTFADNASSPWLDSSGKINIAPELTQWVKQTKSFTDSGYNDRSSVGDGTWAADMGKNGKVFGYFLSASQIGSTLLTDSLEVPVESGGKEEKGNGSFGDWGACAGPQDYFYGGVWIAAARGTDNKDLVTAIMKRLTCDKDTLKMMSADSQDFTNTQSGMKETAASDYASALFGGQNHIAMLEKVAENIKLDNLTAYDQYLDKQFQEAMDKYFEGQSDEAAAEKSFYSSVETRYPELIK